jgi:hypothetical protein
MSKFAIFSIGDEVPNSWVVTDALLNNLPQEDQDALKASKKFTITGYSKKNHMAELQSDDGNHFIFVDGEELSVHYRAAFLKAIYNMDT